MKLIRGISGIRGVVGTTLDGEQVKQYARAFSGIQGDGPILIARDNRHHGRRLMDAAIVGLVDCGRQVDDCDMIPTPTAQFLVERNEYCGGIVITASHNPIEWNGLKFIDADGCFLNAEKNQRIFDSVDENNLPEPQSGGEIRVLPNSQGDHIKHTCSLTWLNAERIRKRKFKIVVDAVNGAGSFAVPDLLKALDCEVIPINCSPDGYFPRKPEPLPENLSILCTAVKEYGAQVGFALDPDGDRLALVDENGKPLGEESTLVLCLEGFLMENATSKPVVTNLSTTQVLDKIAQRYGVDVVRSAVGEINVVNLMKELGSILGGEGNGGVILPESHYGRDALVGSALVLNRMALTEKSLSRIHADLPQYVMVKDKIALRNLNPESVLQRISEHFSTVDQNRVDGLKLIWPDQWVHIRKSNTEPIIRIYAEAPKHEDIDSILTTIKQLI